MITDNNFQNLKILHLPDLVGGHPTALSLGETKLGAVSTTLSYADSPFDYASDIRLKRAKAPFPLRWAERGFEFLKQRSRHDVYHFNFGSSLLNSANGRLLLFDLPYYHKAAIKIMTFQGSEARASYENTLDASLKMEAGLGHPPPVWRDTARLETQKQLRDAMVQKVYEHCDHVLVLNPDLLQGLPKDKTTFFPYATSPPEKYISKEPAPRSSRPLHFVHLSTNRVLKGTGIIETALAKAKDELGISFEIIFRENRETALSAIKNADVVIDQLVLGWYGAVAVEAMYMGKPVMGYISENQATLIPHDMNAELPIIRTTHQTLFDAIRKAVSDRDKLDSLGIKGMQFANKWHHPEIVAVQSVSMYQDLIQARGTC